MSKKVRTPQMPKIPATDLDTRVGVVHLDDIYGPNRSLGGSAASDPLDELDRQERLDAVDELKRLREQKRLLDYRKRVEQLKQEVGAEDTLGGGLAIGKTFNFSAADLQGIAAMPPEERQRFLDTIREISVMASMGGTGGKVNPIMQLAMMGGLNRGGQQGLTAKDVIELQTALSQIYNTRGQGDTEMTRTLLMKLLTETVPSWQNQAMQNLTAAYQAREAALKDQISDPLEQMRHAKEIAGLMGMTPGGQDKEVALARLQMEDRWAMKNYELRLQEIQQAKSLGLIKQILENVDVPGMVRAATRQQVGEQMKPAAHVEEPALPTGAAGQGKTQIMEVQCPNPQCRDAQGQPTRIYAPATATTVTCQSCGGTYQVKLK